MDLGIPYPALVLVHLLAVAAFAAMLLLTAFALPRIAATSAGMAEARRLRRMNLFLATPALLAVWLLGIALAIEGGWLQADWLHGKIALVLLLSGLHGYQTGRLRRLARGTVAPRAFDRRLAPAILIVLALVFVLVTVKPA